MLNIKNISKAIKGKTILNSVSLQVQRGEVAVLLGASGVGKSTLLRALNNLESVDAGSVELDGVALDLKTVNQTHTIGIVFQHFNLFEHLTVEQNITLALEHAAHKTPQQAKQIAHELLARYGLAEKASSFVSRLSGGQKQRLAIARTLALKPQVICLDEPTSALDPLLTSYVAQSIKELADQGFMVLVATHDMSLLEKMPCSIHLMQNGTIAESVRSTDFFACKDNYPQIVSFVTGTTDS
jgi:polar amino acid transport system ATP-binding protein